MCAALRSKCIVIIQVPQSCYRKKMNGKEEEMYNILYEKKQIDDKTPKLRTEDDKKKLRFLINKMRKFPKDLIDNMKTKFPLLQRKRQTAEQRKQQDKECHSRKRSAESEIDKEMRLNKQKEYNDKHSAESDIGKKGD